MARVEIPLTVTTATGDAVTNAIATVNIRGGGVADVYSTATGGVKIPNPISADALGRINGWLDDGSYDVQIAGSGITTYVQPIDVVNGAAINLFDGGRISPGSIPTAALAGLSVVTAKIASQTITAGKLDPNVLPIGTVIEYWRPNNSHVLPTGWLEAKGQPVTAPDHEFTGGGTIYLPDLRNKYVLGADSTKAIGTAGGVNNTVGGAPGVSNGGDNSAGGSNVADLNHQHTMAHDHGYAHSHDTAMHQHYVQVADHLHSFQGLKKVSAAGADAPAQVYGLVYPFYTGASDRVIDGVTGYDTARGTTSQSSSTTGGASNSTTTPALNSTQDMRPKSYGLIHLIKVKNS